MKAKTQDTVSIVFVAVAVIVLLTVVGFSIRSCTQEREQNVIDNLKLRNVEIVGERTAILPTTSLSARQKAEAIEAFQKRYGQITSMIPVDLPSTTGGDYRNALIVTFVPSDK